MIPQKKISPSNNNQKIRRKKIKLVVSTTIVDSRPSVVDLIYLGTRKRCKNQCKDDEDHNNKRKWMREGKKKKSKIWKLSRIDFCSTMAMCCGRLLRHSHKTNHTHTRRQPTSPTNREKKPEWNENEIVHWVHYSNLNLIFNENQWQHQEKKNLFMCITTVYFPSFQIQEQIVTHLWTIHCQHSGWLPHI